MLIDVEKTVKIFETKFNNGEFAKEELPNFCEQFSGDLEEADFRQFEAFFRTELFEKITKI
ncbi:MAG: hypothetical protein LBH24_04520 [Clostridiales bacterium]|jgi:hypothetical protein|nr:hypothetical protein [Clostridiales bacterium]